MKKAFITFICCLMICSTAFACTADVGTASTSVYVRDADNGEIVGSLEKNDKVVVNSVNSKGWASVDINGKNYKIWAEYLEIKETNLDEVKLIEKLRVSKDKNSGLKSKKTEKLSKDSDLYNLGAALWG